MSRNDRIRRSIYFDTPDHRLKSSGIAVRLVQDGGRWWQSVVSRERQSGFLHQSDELIEVAEGRHLDLSAISDAGLRGRIDAAIGNVAVERVFATEVRRCSFLLRSDGGGEAELSIDDGELRAGDRIAPLHAAKLQLVRGEAATLQDVATALIPDDCLYSPASPTAMQGYALAEERASAASIAPRNARVVPLDRAQTAESAARDVLTECLAQIAENAVVTCELDDPEGPHQLRVGLRRLRTAFSLFTPVIRCSELDRLKVDARWLGQEVGFLRDLDVALVDIIDPEAERHPREEGFAVLRDEVERRRRKRRAHVRQVLSSTRARDFQGGMAHVIETRAWIERRDYAQTERLSQKLGTLAERALEKRWNGVRRCAKDIEALDVPDRHELRKELKKLRYAIEFFGPIYPPKKVKPLVKTLKRLQDVFGALNDLAMAEALFTGAGAPCADDPAAQRAVGWVLCARTLRAEDDWLHARQLWQDVKEAGPFWR